MARQAGEEGRIASLEGFVRQFLGTAVGDTQATVAGSVLAQLRRLYGITMSRLAFVCRYSYPPPLEVVVRASPWTSLRRRFSGQKGDFMHDRANGLRRILLPRTRVNSNCLL